LEDFDCECDCLGVKVGFFGDVEFVESVVPAEVPSELADGGVVWGFEVFL